MSEPTCICHDWSKTGVTDKCIQKLSSFLQKHTFPLHPHAQTNKHQHTDLNGCFYDRLGDKKFTG